MQKKRALGQAISLSLLVMASPSVFAVEASAAGAGAVDLDRVEVRPQLESQTRAVDLKRSSDAIEDAVSSDAMGVYPDKNVAESLQRLPGVSVTRDQGEGRFVVIRGLDANLNSVSVDGIAIGTPEDSSRAAPLDVIPSDSTERLRVVKSPTPDMPGDAIGGAILVESASAFDREGRNLRGKIEASHQQLSGNTSPKAAINYSEVFADTFGVALGVNYQNRTFESDNTEVEYGTFDGGADDDLFANSLQRRKYEIERKRIGANLNLDWRPNEDSRYYLRTLYSQFDDAETRQRTLFNVGDGEVTALGNHQYRIDDLPADAIQKRMRYRTKKENTFAASLGGENRLSGAVLDYKVGYTRTEERVNDEMEARFEYAGDDTSATVDQRSRVPGLTLGDAGWMDNGNYDVDRVVLSPKRVDDEEHSAQVNLRFDGDNASYKFGLLGRWRDRNVDTDERELRVGPDIALSDWTTGSPDHRGGSLGQGMSSDAMRRYWAQYGGQYSARPQDAGGNALTSLEEDYTASEDIFASYAMGTWDIGALRIIGGVRVENTQFTATGNSVDVASNGRSYTRDPAQREPQLHQRAARPAPALRRRRRLGAARGRQQDRVAAVVRRHRPAHRPEPGRRGSADRQPAAGPVRIEQHRPVDREVHRQHRYHLAGPVPQVDRRLHRQHCEQQRSGVSGLRGHPRDQRREGQRHRAPSSTGSSSWRSCRPAGTACWSAPAAPGWTPISIRAWPVASVTTSCCRVRPSMCTARTSATRRTASAPASPRCTAASTWTRSGTAAPTTSTWRPTPSWISAWTTSSPPNVSVYFEAQNLLDKPLELYQGTRSRTLQMEEYGRTYALGLKVAL